MLIALLALNIFVLGPVISLLVAGSTGMEAAFGPDTTARRILICVYGSIALTSVGLILMHVAGHAWAVPMTLALFAVQITYKLGTVFLVGIINPVVVTNLFVVALQVCAVAWVLRGI